MNESEGRRDAPHAKKKFIQMGEDKVPTISMFLGILIKMNWKDTGQHNLPHFHAYYGEHEAVFGLDGELIAGKFPKRQSTFVKAWALIHEDELAANWTLAINGEETFRIEPLR